MIQQPKIEETNRNQLKGYGLSSHIVKQITYPLQPLRKDSRGNYYDIVDVISSVKSYLERPRIRFNTRQSLINLLSALRERLDNVIPATFSASSNPEIGQMARKALLALQFAHLHFAEMKSTLATVKGENNGRKSNGKTV